MSTFGVVCFLQLFDWSTPYRCFCWFSSTFHQVSLVPLFTTRGVVAPPENDPIMLGTSIRSFRHLEHQNPSIISDSIGRARMVQQFQRRSRRIGGVGSEEEDQRRRSTVVLEDRMYCNVLHYIALHC